MGEVFFYQKNYQASANAFRGALDGDIDPADKWIEVWCHIYLGKIFDISGDRTRAVNEYNRAQQTNDDTGGAQEEVQEVHHQQIHRSPGLAALGRSQSGQARQPWRIDPFVLDEHAKCLAHPFRMDQRFQQQPPADFLHFARARLVQVRKLIAPAHRRQKLQLRYVPGPLQSRRGGPISPAP